MNDLDLGWLAGLLEGEGSLQLISTLHKGLKGRKSYPSISTKITFFNTDYEIIKKLSNVLDSVTIKPARVLFRDRKDNHGKKRIYEVNVLHYKDIKTVLDLLVMHLVSYKKAQAALISKYITRRLDIMDLYSSPFHSMRRLTGEDFLLVDEYKKLKQDLNNGLEGEIPAISEIEVGWVVGLLEGEGNLQLFETNSKGYNGRKPHRHIAAKVTIYNTDSRIINKLTNILDSMNIVRTGRVVRDRKNHFGKKPIYEVAITRQEDLMNFLNTITPHLVSSKKEQALLIRTFVSRRLERRLLYKSPKHPLRKQSSEDYLLLEQFKKLRGEYYVSRSTPRIKHLEVQVVDQIPIS